MKFGVFLLVLGLLLLGAEGQSSQRTFVRMVFPAAAALPGAPNAPPYWTAERMANSRPRVVNMSRVNSAGSFSMPKGRSSSSSSASSSSERASMGAASAVQNDGVPPSAKFASLPVSLYNATRLASNIAAAAAASIPAMAANTDEGRTAENAAGTSNAYFSSSRLVPLSADLYYPYSAVGKLFFVVDDLTGADPGDYVCSASVIGPRLVLTAGHCVHSGLKSMLGFFREFRFVPSFRNGQAPFGVWTAQRVYATRTWVVGGGLIPNQADYALLVMDDLGGQNIGSVVGQLGYSIQSLAPNHVHMLGYPCRLDQCQRLQTVSTGSFFTVDFAPNCILYGSNFGPGASGGPWVQNFGEPGVSTDDLPVSRGGVNVVVGVTSFVFVDIGVFAAGSSILDSRLTDMVADACSASAGNC
eukprot:m.245219 g.245219  ORF g.245219 m.245219 type:complete len:414 (+) comp35931_c0_seq1:106-1347(+)